MRGGGGRLWNPILIGDEKSIRSILKSITCKKQFRIIHAPLEEAMAEKGVELIEQGTVKALMKGHIHTDQFLHPILAHHLQGKKRISHAFLADLKTYPNFYTLPMPPLTSARILRPKCTLFRMLLIWPFCWESKNPKLPPCRQWRLSIRPSPPPLMQHVWQRWLIADRLQGP